ncbi:mannose-6-phosphate isomerase [Microlunatus sp. GCM10028923]|uniref:mannose-6-phosphate isomerase n=1 Tax=Microlunatus sp. GCM10028923 TaxID=3273400 RepID=UPI00361AF2CB
MTTAPVQKSSYDRYPTVPLPAGESVITGAAAWHRVRDLAYARAEDRPPLIIVDTYPGVDLAELTRQLTEAWPTAVIIDVEQEAARPIEEIDARIADHLTDDRVFGVISHLRLEAFYDKERLAALTERLADRTAATVLIGWGAALAAARPDAVVLVDLARWEIQQRQRAGAPNWRSDNGAEDNLRKYKRGFFIEWRIADRHKRDLFGTIDFLLDGNAIGHSSGTAREPGMITGDAFRGALEAAVNAPLRVVPFFDPGVWGGHWMQDKLGLDTETPNYAWCFDCVPEENSLLLADGDHAVEIPALDLVLSQPRGLLGAKTYARFGAEFPIRFDFLDTVGGGNLSLQVHPLTDYIADTFGMHYTQDESYYLLDADEDAVVYLGLKSGIDPDAMVADLRAAQQADHPFDTEKYVNSFPARKHDHFSIPAGTVHCSGANSMVLEISATPFIFTFKLWDWGRVGLDGIPRPVHVDHGAANIQWDRDTAWVTENLLQGPEELRRDGDVVEERTGLHELEFIEVRRHWFDDHADHHTDGTVNVLNLVEGDEVEVISPTDAFPPMLIHYAETFIIPAAVGPYRIRRTENSQSTRFATVKAYVRGTLSDAAPTPHDNPANAAGNKGVRS